MDYMMQPPYGMRRNSGMGMNMMQNMNMNMYPNMPMPMGMNDMMMPPFNNRNGMMMMNGMDNGMYINDINDYFENTEYRTRAWVEAGKNLHQMQQNTYHWPLYVIEFKAGRTDYFYVPENSGLTIKIGDLVIVEADRGKDLGKVILNNIKTLAQLVSYHAERGNPRHLILDDDMTSTPSNTQSTTTIKKETTLDVSNTTTPSQITEITEEKKEGEVKEKEEEDKEKKTTSEDITKTEENKDKKEELDEEVKDEKEEKKEGGEENKDEEKEKEKKETKEIDEANLQFPKDIHPKRIYRMAQPAEVNMLVQKSIDENTSMVLCQQKVRQRNMPMEVVDAEYQWDRRKLTFYFVSERRIDFRELVRDLFKVYKTRIWMCAVSSLTTIKAYQAFNLNINNVNFTDVNNINTNTTTTTTTTSSVLPATTTVASSNPSEENEKKAEDENKNVTSVKVDENKKNENEIKNSGVNESTTITSNGQNNNKTNTTVVPPSQTPTPPPSLPPSQAQTPIQNKV